MTDDQKAKLDANKEAIKEAFKEASSEWLEAKFAEFGRWSMRGALAAALVALLYFILRMNGWTHTP